LRTTPALYLDFDAEAAWHATKKLLTCLRRLVVLDRDASEIGSLLRVA